MAGSPKKIKANRSVLTNIPPELFSAVMNHASPESLRRVSQVNKLSRSMVKPRLGLRANKGNIVYYRRYHPHPGIALYKFVNNDAVPLQRNQYTPFKYYNGENHRFYTPLNHRKKNTFRALDLKRRSNQNRYHRGHRYFAFEV